MNIKTTSPLSACKQPVFSRGGPKPSLWLIGFGDLLTLMLCFFLSLVAFGPLNQADRQEREALTPEAKKMIQMLKLPIRLATQSGITIAFSMDGYPRLNFDFTEDEFAAEGLAAASLARIVNTINSVNYEIREIRLEICTRRKQGGEGSWSESSLKALGVRSQLLDAGVKAESIKIRSLGRYCRGLGQAHKEKSAVLSFEFIKPVHG